MFPVIPSKVHNHMQKNHTHVWSQDDISLADHSLVGTFQFGTTGRTIIKYLNMIDEKQCKELDKEELDNGIITADNKEFAQLGRW